MLGAENEPLVQLAQANRMTGLGEDSLFNEEAEQEVAKDALRIRPLDSTALRLLSGRAAVDMSRLPDSGGLLLSERISRRDRRTQALLVMLAAVDGDPVASLRHINSLLVVHPRLVNEVTPQLLPIISIEEGRELVSQHGEKEWFRPFVAQATKSDTDPVDVAELIYLTQDKGLLASLETRDLGNLVRRLSNNGAYDHAAAISGIAGLETADLDQNDLASFAPSEWNTDPDFTPFTWMLADKPEGEIELGADGRLHLFMDSSARIDALSRVTKLAPGSYAFGMEVDVLEDSEILGEWRLECNDGNGWVLNSRSGWLPITEEKYSNMDVNVGGNCTVQRWQFTVQSGEGRRPPEVAFSISLSAS